MNTFSEDGTAVPDNEIDKFCRDYARARGYETDDYLRVFEPGTKNFTLRLIATADDLVTQIARFADDVGPDEWISVIASSERCSELLTLVFGAPFPTDNRSDGWKNTRMQSPKQLRDNFVAAGATRDETLDRVSALVDKSKHIRYDGKKTHMVHLHTRKTASKPAALTNK